MNGVVASSMYFTNNNIDLCFVYTNYDKENMSVESFANKKLYGNISCKLYNTGEYTLSLINDIKTNYKLHTTTEYGIKKLLRLK